MRGHDQSAATRRDRDPDLLERSAAVMVDYLAAVRRDAGAIFEMCGAEPGRAIPSCPGWTAADLTTHLLDTFAGEIAGYPDPADELAPPEALEVALDLLSRDPRSDVARAVAQESAVHRWDAACAFAIDYSVEPELACDSIPSFFEDAWPMLLDYLKRPAGSGQTLHLHRTDGEGEWLVTLSERPVVTREHRKADVAVRGTASDLLLWLWGRMDPPEVLGDVSVLEGIRNPAGRFLSPGF